MTRPYQLRLDAPLPPMHPLHWSRFWPNLQRLHKARNEARQDLILWLANLYAGAVKTGKPLAFCEVQVRLMDFRNMVRDYKVALDYFFHVKQTGYYIDDENNEVTTLIPKKLGFTEFGNIDKIANTLSYVLPELPTDTIISKVYRNSNIDRHELINEVISNNRPELIPALNWILDQPYDEFNFHFKPSGKLKLRDTSVWPISGIETWPGWLREKLFGGGIDLDAAYVQFLLQQLRESITNEKTLRLLFPDIVRMLYDKEAFREELCVKVLNLPYTDVNRSRVKQILMSLANGSRISPGLLLSGSSYSQTTGIVLDAVHDANCSQLEVIGLRFQQIANQFSAAKKRVCMSMLKCKASRENQKKVFLGYFEWERKARYAIWEAVDRHGLMVHDGLDGIPARYKQNIQALVDKLDLRLTV